MLAGFEGMFHHSADFTRHLGPGLKTLSNTTHQSYTHQVSDFFMDNLFQNTAYAVKSADSVAFEFDESHTACDYCGWFRRAVVFLSRASIDIRLILKIFRLKRASLFTAVSLRLYFL